MSSRCESHTENISQLDAEPAHSDLASGHGGVAGTLQPGHLAKQAALDRARGPVPPSNPPPTLTTARGKQPSAVRQHDAVHAERPVSKAAPAVPERPVSKAAPSVPEGPIDRAAPVIPENKADNSSIQAQTQPAKSDSPRAPASSARGRQLLICTLHSQPLLHLT